jgi:hypothetical protein
MRQRDQAPASLQPPQQIEILEERERSEPTDPFISGPAHEDRRISVTQAKPAQAWIDPGQKAGRLAGTAESDGEISAIHRRIGQSLKNVADGIFGRLGIRV